MRLGVRMGSGSMRGSVGMGGVSRMARRRGRRRPAGKSRRRQAVGAAERRRHSSRRRRRAEDVRADQRRSPTVRPAGGSGCCVVGLCLCVGLGLGLGLTAAAGSSICSSSRRIARAFVVSSSRLCRRRGRWRTPARFLPSAASSTSSIITGLCRRSYGGCVRRCRRGGAVRRFRQWQLRLRPRTTCFVGGSRSRQRIGNRHGDHSVVLLRSSTVALVSARLLMLLPARQLWPCLQAKAEGQQENQSSVGEQARQGSRFPSRKNVHKTCCVRFAAALPPQVKLVWDAHPRVGGYDGSSSNIACRAMTASSVLVPGWLGSRGWFHHVMAPRWFALLVVVVWWPRKTR